MRWEGKLSSVLTSTSAARPARTTTEAAKTLVEEAMMDGPPSRGRPTGPGSEWRGGGDDVGGGAVEAKGGGEAERGRVGGGGKGRATRQRGTCGGRLGIGWSRGGEGWSVGDADTRCDMDGPDTWMAERQNEGGRLLLLS